MGMAKPWSGCAEAAREPALSPAPSPLTVVTRTGVLTRAGMGDGALLKVDAGGIGAAEAVDGANTSGVVALACEDGEGRRLELLSP